MTSTKSDTAQTLTGAVDSAKEVPLIDPQSSGDSWSGQSLPADSEDPLVGTTLHETYSVVRIIGEGGMGRVYEARHTRIKNKRFALKVLHAEYAANPELQMRFQREAEAAAAIEHPGVVGTYDIGHTPSGSPYMVSEFLNGRDLNSYIVELGPLKQELVLDIGMQLCTALAAAHEKNVIHRDMKPHNVFVLGAQKGELPRRMQVKLLDFGLSRFVDTDSQLTKTGVVLGTPGYMSPEQAQGRETTTLTDIYGIGAILYAASTGRAPFKEKTPQLTVLSVMHKEPARPREVAPAVSPELELVIQRAMARTPTERYPTPDALKSALQGLTTGDFGAFGGAGSGRAGAARLRLFLWVLAALLLLTLWTSSAFLGALTLRGIPFRPSIETKTLLTIGVLATLLPALLVWRQLRRAVWNNTARVVALIEQARSPVVAGLFAYGTAALLIRLSTQVLANRSPALALDLWPGWNLALPLVGALAASTAAVQAKRMRAPWSAWLNGAWGTALGVAGSSAILAYGLWTAGVGAGYASVRSTHPSSAELPTTEQAVATGAPEPAPTAAPSSAPSAPGAAPTGTLSDAGADASAAKDAGDRGQPVAKAATLELASAVAGGAAALEQLARRYPSDPAVLKALVLTHASRASSLPSAVDAIRRLLRLAPEYQMDSDVRVIVSKALLTGDAAGQAASSVLRNAYGRSAGDLVYDLLLRHPARRAELSREFLALRSQGRASQASELAYALRFAPSCESRLKLLPTASRVGDERAAAVLSSLISKPARCAPGQRCSAQCPKEQGPMAQALRAIQERLAAKHDGASVAP